jgi:hypothetical protein
VYVVMPGRDPGRAPRAKGEQLAALVPADAPLYLFGFKDEGILFYYGRPARRLPGPWALPPAGGPCYCLLRAVECQPWPWYLPAEPLRWLRDEQGAPVVLVKVWVPPAAPPPPAPPAGLPAPAAVAGRPGQRYHGADIDSSHQDPAGPPP